MRYLLLLIALVGCGPRYEIITIGGKKYIQDNFSTRVPLVPYEEPVEAKK